MEKTEIIEEPLTIQKTTPTVITPIPEAKERIEILFSETVWFPFGKATLNEDAIKILNRLIENLKRYPDSEILVEGYTCNIGDPKFNLRLSNARARAVYNYLIKHGIEKKKE